MTADINERVKAVQKLGPAFEEKKSGQKKNQHFNDWSEEDVEH